MATPKDFDPLAYIESAFLDTNPTGANRNGGATSASAIVTEPASKGVRFRKTALSAPRPRRVKTEPEEQVIDHEFKAVLENLPRTIGFLGQFFNDSVTAHYYQGGFQETRQDLIRRLLDPELTLEEASRLLGVCPATVRRYTNRGWLDHHRTQGGQRRFRLSSVVKFVEAHGRTPQS